MDYECYFRIYVDKNGKVCFPEMQEFDEHDYDQKKFLNDKKYETEEEARDGFLLMREKARMIVNLKMEDEHV